MVVEDVEVMVTELETAAKLAPTFMVLATDRVLDV
jgi:hypothetical protein